MAKDQRGNDVPVHRYNSDDSQAGEIKSKWWNQPEDEMHRHIFGVVKHIRQAQSYRSANNLRYIRLYGNREIMSLQPGGFARDVDQTSFLKNVMSYNVVKACVDTAAAKVGSRKTRPLFLTDDGDWTLQRRAEMLTKYMEGAFDSMGTGTGDNRTLYGIGRRAFVDGCVVGTGVVKFYPDADTNSVKAERVLVEEIVVDETEGMYESPRQLHQEKLVHREVLADMFPKHADKIRAAESGLDSMAMSQSSADMIKVIESWHLPSGATAGDGKKVLSIENCTLRCDEWKKDYFPFLFKRWHPRVLGFYGQGLAEELVGIQLEVNKTLRNIARAQHLMAKPQVWLEMQNKVNERHLNNEMGGAKYYLGQPPLFMVPQAMSAEVYNHLETLYQKAFEITGISMLSAASRKPSGLDSGVALREYQDIESERFQLVAERDQDFYIEAAYLTMDLMGELKNPKVRVKDGQGTKEIAWKEVCIDRDKLDIRAFPTDLLPSTPAGKLQKVQELLQAGMLDKDEGLELLEFPDTKHTISVKTAARKDIRRMIEKMTDTGDYETPEPFMDLQYGRNMAQAYYLKGRTEGMPEDRLELLRRFSDDCQAMLMGGDQAQAAAGAADQVAMAEAEIMGGEGAAPAGDPMAQPETAPVSDLLPIAQ